MEAEMKIEVHLLTYNEAQILPYSLRHYRTFAEKIVVHDSFSKDDTRSIAASFGAEIRDWDTGGKLNDLIAAKTKSTAWKGTDADWVICVDADELVYFPEGLGVLQTYLDSQIGLVKTTGWELSSRIFPTTTGQIYDEVKTAAPEIKWYSKPALFTPHLVRSVEFGVGAHDCVYVLKTGKRLPAPKEPTTPATWLLHCHHLGPLDRIADRYAKKRTRLSQANVQHRWGNFDPAAKHALDKRNMIESNLRQIIP